MSKHNSLGDIDVAVAGGFGILAIISCLCGGGTLLIAGIDNTETYYELLPLLLGAVVALAITALLVLFRQRQNISNLHLLISVLLWLMGAAIFSFGLTAILLYEEPAEFVSNLGFSVILCLLPGSFLSLLGLILYAFEARRGRKTAVLTTDDSLDLLESMKAKEKSELEDDLWEDDLWSE